MGWPGLGIWGGLSRRRKAGVERPFGLPWPVVRPFWRPDPGLEAEVLAQLLERGE
jgi:hypothetical protein